MAKPVTTAAKRLAVVVVAAGRGTRAGGNGPKQYRQLGGRAMLAHTLDCFSGHPAIGSIVVVIHPDDGDLFHEAAGAAPRLLPPVPGGATRQASVRCGLEALAALSPAPDGVLIHDAARPFVEPALIDRVVAALARAPGALPGVAVADTLKRTAPDRLVTGTADRTGLWRAQTPQGFHFAPILAAHRAAASAGRSDFTDDAAIAEWAGLSVLMVEGSERNRKLTTEEDCRMADDEMKSGGAGALPLNDIRTGSGFDVHRFTVGDHVWLCGVRVPHTEGVEAHSDGDVALHALTDALLGAIGDGDIGVHFPPSDPQWRGAASDKFVAEAVRRVAARGGVVSNADITVLCERPKIGPHREAMRARLAALLGISVDRTSVKATTTERLGFTGRSEGLAAMATVTVRLPGH